ncbi:hypothetical protein D9615_002813 [Tricholomella constricta]|uniref:Uncharacterized protein n=1 Tax=Tricholomella constricta TaxID=117010 RepID=A0A8H5HG29_9AGAR|nr:hypothetical protein D9615_002813 [Tricholomella constricta]
MARRRAASPGPSWTVLEGTSCRSSTTPSSSPPSLNMQDESKRKRKTAAASLSAKKPPKKKSKADDGRGATLTHSADTSPPTPAREPSRPKSTPTIPLRQSTRRPAQRNASPGPSSQPIEMHRTRSHTSLVASKKRVRTPNADDDDGDKAPPRSSSLSKLPPGRAQKKSNAPPSDIGSFKAPLTTRKRTKKRTATSKEVIELFSSSEDEKGQPAKQRRHSTQITSRPKKKPQLATEIIDLCSDVDSPPLSRKTTTGRTAASSVKPAPKETPSGSREPSKRSSHRSNQKAKFADDTNTVSPSANALPTVEVHSFGRKSSSVDRQATQPPRTPESVAERPQATSGSPVSCSLTSTLTSALHTEVSNGHVHDNFVIPAIDPEAREKQGTEPQGGIRQSSKWTGAAEEFSGSMRDADSVEEDEELKQAIYASTMADGGDVPTHTNRKDAQEEKSDTEVRISEAFEASRSNPDALKSSSKAHAETIFSPKAVSTTRLPMSEPSAAQSALLPHSPTPSSPQNPVTNAPGDSVTAAFSYPPLSDPDEEEERELQDALIFSMSNSQSESGSPFAAPASSAARALSPETGPAHPSESFGMYDQEELDIDKAILQSVLSASADNISPSSPTADTVADPPGSLSSLEQPPAEPQSVQEEKELQITLAAQLSSGPPAHPVSSTPHATTPESDPATTTLSCDPFSVFNQEEQDIDEAIFQSVLDASMENMTPPTPAADISVSHATSSEELQPAQEQEELQIGPAILTSDLQPSSDIPRSTEAVSPTPRTLSPEPTTPVVLSSGTFYAAYDHEEQDTEDENFQPVLQASCTEHSPGAENAPQPQSEIDTSPAVAVDNKPPPASFQAVDTHEDMYASAVVNTTGQNSASPATLTARKKSTHEALPESKRPWSSALRSEHSAFQTSSIPVFIPGLLTQRLFAQSFLPPKAMASLATHVVVDDAQKRSEHAIGSPRRCENFEMELAPKAVAHDTSEMVADDSVDPLRLKLSGDKEDVGANPLMEALKEDPSLAQAQNESRLAIEMLMKAQETKHRATTPVRDHHVGESSQPYPQTPTHKPDDTEPYATLAQTHTLIPDTAEAVPHQQPQAPTSSEASPQPQPAQRRLSQTVSSLSESTSLNDSPPPSTSLSAPFDASHFYIRSLSPDDDDDLSTEVTNKILDMPALPPSGTEDDDDYLQAHWFSYPDLDVTG